MNMFYRQTNLGLFTLERCDDYNQSRPESFGTKPYWRVQSHNIFGWHPCWGPFQKTRTSAILSWLGYVWEEFFKS